MTLFDDRERAFELKFVHDLEMEFRARLMRNRMMAEWAAEQMKLSREETRKYVHDNVAALIRKIDDLELLERIRVDMNSRGIAVDERQLRSLVDGFAARAMESLGAVPENGPRRHAP